MIMIALMTSVRHADAMWREKFQPAGCYLDSATYGLPLSSALEEFSAVTSAWASGSYDPVSCDRVIHRARGSFARLHGISAADVAIGHQVSPMVGLIAASLPRGSHVLAAEGEFTSLVFPFLAAGCAVRTVALEQLAEAVDRDTDLVAVSAVQSADGRLAALDAIAQAASHHGTLTLVDATQACGWLPLDAGQFSVVVAGGYKWLCHPRGTAFMTIAPELRERFAPLAAGWYAGENPWERATEPPCASPATPGVSMSPPHGSAGTWPPPRSTRSNISASKRSTSTTSRSRGACAPSSDSSPRTPRSSRSLFPAAPRNDWSGPA